METIELRATYIYMCTHTHKLAFGQKINKILEQARDIVESGYQVVPVHRYVAKYEEDKGMLDLSDHGNKAIY